MRYYSAYDLQCNCYFGTGRDSKTKKKCLEDIYDYLMSTCDEKYPSPKKMSTKQLLSEVGPYDVRIDMHTTKIGESYGE